MKVGEYEVQEGLYYTKTHEWAKVEGDNVKIGICDYAQKSLKDLVYIEFIDSNEESLNIGTQIEANKQIGAIESVKATSEVFSPVSGEIININKDLEDSPEMANEEPYGKGWLIVVKPKDLNSDLKNLMTDKKYMEYLKQTASEH